MTAKQTTPDTATTAQGRPTVPVVLQTPIVRNGETVTTLQLMKPRTGDLRGLLLAEVLQMKADTVAALLPRITVPTITEPEVSNMDTADLVTMAMEVAAFLTPKAVLESLQQ